MGLLRFLRWGFAAGEQRRCGGICKEASARGGPAGGHLVGRRSKGSVGGGAPPREQGQAHCNRLAQLWCARSRRGRCSCGFLSPTHMQMSPCCFCTEVPCSLHYGSSPFGTCTSVLLLHLVRTLFSLVMHCWCLSAHAGRRGRPSPVLFCSSCSYPALFCSSCPCLIKRSAGRRAVPELSALPVHSGRGRKDDVPLSCRANRSTGLWGKQVHWVVGQIGPLGCRGSRGV